MRLSYTDWSSHHSLGMSFQPSPFTSAPWSPHLLHVTVNELILKNTHSRGSIGESFLSSSFLKKGSEYCHCRSDCVPGGEPAEAQPATLGRPWGGPQRQMTADVSKPLGDGGHCTLHGSLYPDGIQCPLLSLGIVHSLNLQTLKPLQYKNGQPRSNPGQPHFGPLF